LKEGGFTLKRDDTYKVPYAVKDKLWIGYDDIQSITDKVEFLKSRKLAGGMVWSLDTDDFRNKCGLGPYPLMKTISAKLNNGKGPDPTENPITIKPTHPPQSAVASSDSEFKCTEIGFFPDPKDKHIFYECVDNGNDTFKKVTLRCEPGKIFDSVRHECVSGN